MEISTQKLSVVTDEIPKNSSLGLETKFNNFLFSLAKTGEQNRNSNIIPKWHGNKPISYLYTQILLTKYKSTCTHIAKYVIKNNWSGLTNEQIERKENKMIKEIGKCIRKGNEKIIMFQLFLSFDDKRSGHENTLIFRRKTSTIEHFEPHGIEYSKKDYVKEQLTNFIIKLNNYLSNTTYFDKNKPITLIYSDEVCPMIGPQRLQQRNSLIKKQPNERGFCAIWSLLLGELSLKFPDFTTKEIIDKLLKLFPTGDKLLFLITGYIVKTNLILAKNMTHILNKNITETTIYDESNLKALQKNIKVNKIPSIIFSPSPPSLQTKGISDIRQTRKRKQVILYSPSKFQASTRKRKRVILDSPYPQTRATSTIRSTRKRNRDTLDSPYLQTQATSTIHSTRKRNQDTLDSPYRATSTIRSTKKPN